MHDLAQATDWDGTIADDGVVDQPTLAALERPRDGARRLPLFTMSNGEWISRLSSCLERKVTVPCYGMAMT